jgi:hypothetical protein
MGLRGVTAIASYYILGYEAVECGRNLPMFQRNVLAPSRGLKSKEIN